jgi:hypothetical protein
MIILLSDTPVAGTITRLAKWMQSEFNIDVLPLVRRNYSHNAFDLPYGAFGALDDWERFLSENIASADFIFIHNVFDSSLLNCAFTFKKDTTPIFFQYHSPPQEPPAYQFSVLDDYPFSGVFTVSQGYGRFNSDAILVPNIVPDFTHLIRINKGSDIFIPHIRSTDFRWSQKCSSNDVEFVKKHNYLYDSLKITTVKSVFDRDHVTYGEVQLYLQSCLGVIDDIHTGLFHQTTIEALKAGCGVFSAADIVSQEEFCIAANADPLPLISVSGIDEVVGMLAGRSSREEIKREGLRSKEYAEKFLTEERLAKRFCEILQPFLT